MEGRINRDSLATGTAKQTQERERTSSYETYTPRKTGRSTSIRGDYRGYKRRNSPSRRDLIPEGKDMMMVQLLASGILLLFVMFIAVVPEAYTKDIKIKLKGAFSDDMPIDTVSHGFESLKNSILGKDDPVTDETEAAVVDTTADTSTIADDIVVDPEMLKEINEKAGTQKN